MKIKKTISLLSIALIGVLVLPLGVALASPPTDIWTSWQNIQNFIEFIQAVIWFVFTIAVVVCFALAGFFFLTAAGDETKVAKAKTWVKYGIIGVAVGLLAGGMMTLVQNLMESDPGTVSFLLNNIFL